MTRYQPSTRNTRTARLERATSLILLAGVLVVLVVVAVLLNDLYAAVTDVLDQMDTEQVTR